MRTREKILIELDEAQKNALVSVKMQLPQEVAMQAGANAPIMATALALLVEVVLDIRDMVYKAGGFGPLVIEPANAEQLEKLAAEGKLPGLDELPETEELEEK